MTGFSEFHEDTAPRAVDLGREPAGSSVQIPDPPAGNHRRQMRSHFCPLVRLAQCVLFSEFPQSEARMRPGWSGIRRG